MRTDQQRIHDLEHSVTCLITLCFYLLDPERCTPPELVRERVIDELLDFLNRREAEHASRN